MTEDLKLLVLHSYHGAPDLAAPIKASISQSQYIQTSVLLFQPQMLEAISVSPPVVSLLLPAFFCYLYLLLVLL